MSILPTVNDDHQAMTIHRQRLVRTIDNTARWRRNKVEEFAHNHAGVRRSNQVIAALESLAEYVEGLEDDDPDLRLTYRAFHDLGEHQSIYLVADANLRTLGRYGLGFSGNPSDDDHSKFLNDLASVELQAKTMTDQQRTKRLIDQTYKTVRQLRHIQERTNADVAAQIENGLAAIWDATYVSENQE